MVSTNIATNGVDFDKLKEFQIISHSKKYAGDSNSISFDMLNYLPLNTGHHLTNRIFQKYMSNAIYIDRQFGRAEESPAEVVREIYEDILTRSCKDFEFFTKKLLLDYGGNIVGKNVAHREGYVLVPYPESMMASYCLNFGKSFSRIFNKHQPFLNDYFQVRHVVSHNDSIVDEKYLKHTKKLGKELGATLGCPILIARKLVLYGANVMIEICVELALEMNQIQKFRQAS